jgi:hypothetical protein
MTRQEFLTLVAAAPVGFAAGGFQSPEVPAPTTLDPPTTARPRDFPRA